MKCAREIIALIAMFLVLISPVSLSVEAATVDEIDLTSENNRFYLFQNVHSGKYLEVADGSITSGTTVWQDTFNYDTNRAQVFRITAAYAGDMANGDYGDDYYQIKPIEDATLRFDVDNANDANGTNIKIFDYNSGYGAQSFRFIENGDGSFRIEPYLSRGSKRVLTVVNASTSNKANVILSDWTGDTSQRWVAKEFYQTQDPKLINLNWSYFFHGDDASIRRISRRILTSAGSVTHAGIDIPADEGTHIYSPCDGKVIEVGVEGDNIAESMGNYVIIRSTDTIIANGIQKSLIIRIMHMNNPPEVSLNDLVDSNDKLGGVGDTGESDGSHLHIDVNIGSFTGGNQIRSNPQYIINPEKLLMKKGFKYGMSSSNAKYAVGGVFYPNWALVE